MSSLSNEASMQALKTKITGAARSAVRKAADYLVTQLNAAHPDKVSAHVEMSPTGISAQVIVSDPVGLFLEYGTGIYGMAETAPHRQTPWVYQSEDGNFYTSRGQQPNPWFKKTCEMSKDMLEILMRVELRDSIEGLSPELPEGMDFSSFGD